MGLYIRDESVRELASELAARRRCTMTEAVRDALTAGLDRERSRVDDKMATLRRIQAEIAALPDLAPGFTDKDLYDENGDPIL